MEANQFYEQGRQILLKTLGSERGAEESNDEREAILLAAESLLQKALMIAQKANDHSQSQLLIYRIWNLQIYYYTSKDQKNACKHLLKLAISQSEANKTQADWIWHCHFLRKRLELQEHDWESYWYFSKEAAQACVDHGDKGGQCVFLLLRIQVAFSEGKIDLIHGWLSEVETMMGNSSDTMDRNCEYLMKIYLIFSSFYNLYIGNNENISSSLVALHEFLDQHGEEEEDDPLPEDPSLGENRELSDDLASKKGSRFFEYTLPYLLAFLISGLIYKSSDSKKSRLYLEEGLKNVSECLETIPPFYYDSLFHLKVCLTLNLFEIDLFQSNLIAAAKGLIELSDWIIIHPTIFSFFELELMLNWGLLFHAVGLHEKAESIYQKVKASDSTFLSWIASLNLCLLKPESSTDVQDLINPSAHDKALTSLLQASKHIFNREVKLSKQELLKGFKLSTEYRNSGLASLFLALLGSMFLITNESQAKAMLERSLTLAKQAGTPGIIIFGQKLSRSVDSEINATFEEEGRAAKEIVLLRI